MALQEVRAQWGWDSAGQQLVQLLQVAFAAAVLRSDTMMTVAVPPPLPSHASSSSSRLLLFLTPAPLPPPQLLPDFLYWHYSPAMFYSDGFEEGLAIISKVRQPSPPHARSGARHLLVEA